NDSSSLLVEGTAEWRLQVRPGNITERAQHSQADGDIRSRVQTYLLKCRFQYSIETDPQDTHAGDTGRIIEDGSGQLPGHEADQDAAQLVDAGDRRGRIIYRRGDCLQRDIDNLQNSELDVLLQRPRRAQIKRAENLAYAFGRQPIPLVGH